MTEKSPDAVEVVAAALVDRYGPEALAVAQGQHKAALDGMKVTWAAVVDQIVARP